MTIEAVLSLLAQHKITVSTQDGQLKIRAPKGSMTPELRDILRGHKAELVAYLERKQGDRATLIARPVESVSRDTEIPLAYVQRRLWFLYHLEGGSATYNMPSAFRLRGDLNVPALKKSFAAVIERHEILRTTFPEGKDGPYQLIHAQMPLEIPLIDVSELPGTEREATVEQLADLEGAMAFDLTNGPLFRIILIRLSSQEHITLINMHHIISDGWSRGLLVKEFVALYRAHLEDGQPSLSPLPIQYADFAAWQRDWLRGEEVDRQLAFWKRRLGDLPPLLELPTDFPRPAVQVFRGDTCKVTLPKTLADDLNDLAKKHEASLFMVTLAAWQLVLSFYARRSHIPIGTPIATRYRKEIEPLIGFFVNTIVLSNEIDWEKTFSGLLTQIRQDTLTAYNHQDVPFDQIVEELHPKRSTSYQPIFQVLFQVRNMPSGELALPGLKLSSVEKDHQVSKFDLNLSVTEVPDGLYLVLEYNAALFRPETAARYVDQFQTVLENIAAQPQVPLKSWRMLGGEETAELKSIWNGPVTDYDQHHYVHQLFEDQVAKRPDAIAAAFGEDRLTYAQLDRAANQLAHLLIGKGAGPERPVALHLNRSLDMLLGVLAIVKTGSIYVPLDPGYPEDRIAAILTEAKPAVLLTGVDLADMEIPAETSVVNLATERDAMEQAPNHAPNPQLTPDSLVYIIYTSGSTGKPKGVSMRQQPLLNLFHWHAETLPLADEAVVTQFASINFDVSFQEIFSTWAAGATLVVVPDEARLDPNLLMQLLEDQKVARAFMPVVMLQQLAQVHARTCKRLPNLKQVITAGEQLHVTDVVRQFFIAMPHLELHNHYGPSETHVVTAHTLEGEAETWDTYPSIGKPLCNTGIYLLDPWHRPVPTGIFGELWIAGDHVGRGYYGQAARTAERFCPDAFATEPGARVYRTGDLARFLPDGTLDFAGRIDQQVQIRGFRVELGEIETLLTRHPDVGESVVMVREDQPGRKMLVAYVVPSEGLLPDVSDLRAHVQAKLPDYMVPSAFVVLKEMPVTPNGKIDRRKLPAPDHTHKTGFVAPRSPLEEELALIWCDVLKLDRVGVEDDFFEIGGHSLLATQVASRILQTLKVDLQVMALFEHPTIALQAKLAERERLAGEGLTPPPIEPRGQVQDPPLSFSQQRLWFLENLEDMGGTYNISAAVAFKGYLRVELLEECIQTIIARHESLRTTFSDRDGVPFQVIAPELKLPLPIVDLEGSETRAAEYAQRDADIPFDLAAGPLIRTTLLRIEPTHHVLLVSMHHIISDGWSLGVFIKEFENLYRSGATAEGELPPTPLPDLGIQYPDFALWQNQWLKDEILAKHLAFWRESLGGELPVLELPTDHPRPRHKTYRGNTETLTLGDSLSDAVRALGREAVVTELMTMLTAFKCLLYRYTGQKDLIVGVPIANRNRLEIEPLIGFFINTLALRTRLPEERENLTFRKILLLIRENTLGAYHHQDLPFEKIVEELQPSRDLGRTPVFQVMFSVQNLERQKLNLPDVTITPFGKRREAAKFDLNMTVHTSGDGFAVSLNYNADLFQATTVKRMLDHYRRLLEAMVADPDKAVQDVDFLGEEATKLIHQWNDTSRDHAFQPVHHDFTQWAARQGEATAVIGNDFQLTYQELAARSARIAHWLTAHDAGDVTAICMDRSPHMITALLAVLQSGGAYLPVDPHLPDARIQDLLTRAGVSVVLTQTHLRDREPLQERRTLALDQCADTLADYSDTPPTVTILPQQPAYVVFTSGSTGTPKGVVVTHANLHNYLHAVIGRFDLLTGCRYAMVSTFAADLGNTAIYPALTTGGSLLLPDEDHITNPVALAAFMQDHPADYLKITPSHLEALMAGADSAVLPRRLLILGGEATPVSLLSRIQTAAPDLQVANHYGPAEATVGVLTYEAASNDRCFPVGLPLDNVRAHILDPSLNLVPIGLPGDLYLGGASITQGYLGQPARTAERFVPDPFSQTPGERLYHTGDRVRRHDDGHIDFMGRTDDQIKIRGFRVELGEVESQLATMPEVDKALVLTRDDGSGPQLLAWLQAASGDASLAERALVHLRERLPDYMIPAGVAVLETMPLNANGKIDRKALPDIQLKRSTSLDLPRSPVEEMIADIFGEVLRLDRVGIHDSFFNLGGHSLLATRIIARVQKGLAVSLSLRHLFQTPTVAGLAACIEEMRRQDQGLHMPAVTPVPRDQDLPLSFAQQRLWFIDKFEPNAAFYNMPRALRFSGALDSDVLRACIEEITHRHEILRTTFTTRNHQPVQIIHTETTLPFELIDLRDHPDKEQAAERHRIDHARQPFDLEQGPIWRLSLLRLDEEDHLLLVNMHHIISDGWSTSLFVGELYHLYRAFLNGEPSPLAPLPAQYADYAQWQRNWLQGEVLQTQLAFWKQHLGMNPPPLNLPLDRPRPARQTFKGADYAFELQAADTLRDLVRREETTLFVLLLAAFKILLSRYSGQSDIIVGSPIANRNRVETESLIGFFVNTLALRTDLSGNPSFRELLARLKEVTLSAHAHQDLPFERLVEEIQTDRAQNHSPIFQVMFVVQNTPSNHLELPGLEITQTDSFNESAKFDITLSVREAEGISASLNYNTTLFDPQTIQRMAEHFQTLLGQLLTHPDTGIDQFDLMSSQESRRLLHEWNDTQLDYDPSRLVLDLFDEQVAQHPDRAAVLTGDSSRIMTFAELHQASDQVAARLSQQGLSADQTAVVCLERGVAMAVAILGIVKAGGAYVPVDPEFPESRIDLILQDSGARVMITAEGTPAPAAFTGDVLELNGQGALTGSESAPQPFRRPALHREQLAYVIFTSGSTGRPKGVAISHGALLDLVSWHRETFGTQSEQRATLLTSPAFDAAVWDFWAYLSTGGTLCMPDADTRLEPKKLLQWMAATGVTHSLCPTPLAEACLTETKPDNLALEVLFAGGDRLTRRPSTDWSTRFMNAYGPTECAVVSTWTQVDPEPTDQHPSIGRPVANAALYVVDATMRPVPQGMPGELLIGGPGLGRGYLNKLAVTASVFVPDPFGDTPGARLYRTGDLVRYLPDGHLDFLGRADNQVKIRGFRIELGEIEAVLQTHAEIREAVVQVVGAPKRLAAWLVTNQGTPVQDLSTWLTTRLPEYMIPSSFTTLETLPRNAGGKVDRRALPAPVFETTSAEHQPPATPTQEAVAEIWVEVLQIARVGAGDHFFSLGGHSLRAAQVISRVTERFGKDIPLRTLFEHPVLAEFATVIDEALLTAQAPTSLSATLTDREEGEI